MTKWIKASQISSYLKPDMTVFIAGGTAEPKEILRALEEQPDCCANVRFISMSFPGINTTNFADLNPHTRVTSFFATPETREDIHSGRIDYIPIQYRSIYSYLENGIDIDMAIAQFPEPFEDGSISLGISVDFLPAVIDKAKFIVGEINNKQPAPKGSPTLHFNRLDIATKSSHSLPTSPVIHLNESAVTIAHHVAGLINDGDCVQIGIGAIPDATLAVLFDKNDLGFHSGMLADGIMALMDSGNATGSAKNIDKGFAVVGATLGSHELIEWAMERTDLLFRPVNYTHDIGVVRQIDNFVSINSALQIDLFGQVNADMLDGRQISGTGGSVDLMRGASLSKGGRSVLALYATAANGTISRIVPTLSTDTAATALRTDIDYIVTEYGVRRIRHLSFHARAEALIELAAPKFRDDLMNSWRIIF